MAFCIKCGTKLYEGRKFCHKCGQQVLEEENIGRTYVGKVKKCPNCGGPVSDYKVSCPFCGVDFVSVGLPDSVKEFSKQLSIIGTDYEYGSSWRAWGIGKKIGWIILWIYFLPFMLVYYFFSRFTFGAKKLSQVESQRANFIETFTFSKDKETTYESLTLIRNQLDVLEILDKNAYRSFWVNLWLSKAKQVYSVAKVSIEMDAHIEGIYSEIVTKSSRLLNEVKRAKYVYCLLAVICIFAIYVFPKIAVNNIISRNAETYEKTLTELPDRNSISNSKIVLSGIMGECFDVSDADAVIEFDKDSQTAIIQFPVICKKNMASEIKKRIEEEGITKDVKDTSSVYYYINGEILIYASSYGLEGMTANSLFEQLLDAEEGDVVEIELLSNCSAYKIKYYVTLMSSDKMIISLSIHYFDSTKKILRID